METKGFLSIYNYYHNKFSVFNSLSPWIVHKRRNLTPIALKRLKQINSTRYDRFTRSHVNIPFFTQNTCHWTGPQSFIDLDYALTRLNWELATRTQALCKERDVLLWKGCSPVKGMVFWERDVFSERGMFFLRKGCSPERKGCSPEKGMPLQEMDVLLGMGCSLERGMLSWETDVLVGNPFPFPFSWEKGCFFWERDALLGRDGLLCEFTCQTKLTTEKYEPQFPLQCNSQQSFGRRQDAMCDDLFTTA